LDKFVSFIDPAQVMKDLTSVLWIPLSTYVDFVLHLYPNSTFEYYYKPSYNKGMVAVSGNFGMTRVPIEKNTLPDLSNITYPLVTPVSRLPSGISLVFKVDRENTFKICVGEKKPHDLFGKTNMEFDKYQEIAQFAVENSVLDNKGKQVLEDLSKVNYKYISPSINTSGFTPAAMYLGMNWVLMGAAGDFTKKNIYVTQTATNEFIKPRVYYCGNPTSELIGGDACCHKFVADILDDIWNNPVHGKFSEKFSCDVKSQLAEEVGTECMKNAMTDQEIRIALVTKLLALEGNTG